MWNQCYLGVYLGVSVDSFVARCYNFGDRLMTTANKNSGHSYEGWSMCRFYLIFLVLLVHTVHTVRVWNRRLRLKNHDRNSAGRTGGRSPIITRQSTTTLTNVHAVTAMDDRTAVTGYSHPGTSQAIAMPATIDEPVTQLNFPGNTFRVLF